MIYKRGVHASVEWVHVLVSHQGARERESTAERRNGREWTACEMQASSPTNSRKVFQLGISWVHHRFKRGYISWGVIVSFGKYCEWCTRDSGLGIKLLSVILCYIDLTQYVFCTVKFS
ncbi:unnamed protein product [Prunus brigantina]